MKNREFRTLIAAVMLTTLVAGSVGTTPAYVFAAEETRKYRQNKKMQKQKNQIKKSLRKIQNQPVQNRQRMRLYMLKLTEVELLQRLQFQIS